MYNEDNTYVIIYGNKAYLFDKRNIYKKTYRAYIYKAYKDYEIYDKDDLNIYYIYNKYILDRYGDLIDAYRALKFDPSTHYDGFDEYDDYKMLYKHSYKYLFELKNKTNRTYSKKKKDNNENNGNKNIK